MDLFDPPSYCNFFANRAWSNPTKTYQIELLKEKSATNDSSLYTQLYIEACATSDTPALCQDDDLLAAASNFSDNLSVWLSLINFYNNQGDSEKISELVALASESVQIDNLQTGLYREVFDNALTLTGSPKYSSYLMLNYASTRLYGLGALKKHCAENGGENCFKIGELLEKNSSRNAAKKAGIVLQIDYFRESLNITEFPEKERALNELNQQTELSISDLNIPYSDEMAYFLADNLFIEDELEYAQSIQQKAQSLLADDPSLCAW